MSRLFCLALMLFGLGGCGEGGTTPTPLLFASTCGEIVLSGSPVRAGDAGAARRSADCFVQAFDACAPSSLTVRDTTNNSIRQFTIIPGASSCTLRQAFQSDPNSPPAVADCTGAQIKGNTLVITDCSHLGDFTLTP